MVQQLPLKSLDFSIGCREKVDSNSGTNFEVLHPCGGKASRIAVRKGNTCFSNEGDGSGGDW